MASRQLIADPLLRRDVRGGDLFQREPDLDRSWCTPIQLLIGEELSLVRRAGGGFTAAARHDLHLAAPWAAARRRTVALDDGFRGGAHLKGDHQPGLLWR